MPVVGSVAELYCGKFLYAVFIRRALIWSGVSDGVFCINSAAAPLTTGAAMLVPLSLKYTFEAELPPRLSKELVGIEFAGGVHSLALVEASVEMVRLPGATRSGFTTWSKIV